MFTKRLPYVSFNDLFVLPSYHELLYGVMRKIWELACDGAVVMKKPEKDLIKARAWGMVPTNDFNSVYSCIFDNRKNWKIYK